MNSTRLLRRARLYLLLDSILRIAWFPLKILIWILVALYVLFCMFSWGITLWVLGERHIGILKMLIVLCSLTIWVLIITSAYSFWL